MRLAKKQGQEQSWGVVWGHIASVAHVSGRVALPVLSGERFVQLLVISFIIFTPLGAEVPRAFLPSFLAFSLDPWDGNCPAKSYEGIGTALPRGVPHLPRIKGVTRWAVRRVVTAQQFWMG